MVFALLSTRNATFAKLQVLIIRLDNTGEFTSKTFDDYCMSNGIEVKYLAPHDYNIVWSRRRHH